MICIYIVSYLVLEIFANKKDSDQHKLVLAFIGPYYNQQVFIFLI